MTTMDRKQRNKVNIFSKNKVGEEKPRESDKDYLDTLDEVPVRTRSKSQKSGKPTQKEYVRHTFIIHPEDLKDLQDIVHTIKSNGNYKYTQKEALTDAIAQLKNETQQKYGEIKSVE